MSKHDKSELKKEIEYLPIDAIIPYQHNNRVHSDKQIDLIANSINEFGFNQPIVIDENNIILVGHGRLLAAQKLNLKTVPVHKALNLTEAQKKAYRILDNKLQNDSTWDFDNLNIELESLKELDFDLNAWGLDELKLETNLDPEIKEDEFDESICENDETFIKLGDVIELGKHRVMCGDSMKSEDVAELMVGEKAGCLITDPPYGIGWEGSHVSTLKWEAISNDSGKLDLRRILSDYEIVVSFGANCYPSQLPHRGRWIVWDKRVDENADRMLGSPFELAWTSKQSGYDKIYRIMHGGVVNADGHNERRNHPTQKPIKLLAAIIQDYAQGLILDLFLGSGTTLIAADQLNRICYGMEISPKYCQIILERYKKHCEKTNKQFVCKINGEEYNP